MISNLIVVCIILFSYRGGADVTAPKPILSTRKEQGVITCPDVAVSPSPPPFSPPPPPPPFLISFSLTPLFLHPPFSLQTVRRHALLSVTAVVHAHPSVLTQEVIRDRLWPTLFSACKLSLVRVVDYGPFKQKVDDGLLIRKAAFQCIDTVLCQLPHRTDLPTVLRHIEGGLVDHEDVQILTYQIMYNLSARCPTALLEVLDSLPNVIMPGIKAKLKEAKGADGSERAKDVLRVAVRALHALHNIEGVEECSAFCKFYQRVLKTNLLAQMLTEMKAREM